MKKIIYTIILVLVAVLVFWIGRFFGSKTVSQQVISNSTIVKEIAELSSLDVQGSASIKRSNLTEGGSDWTDNLKKTFLENTIWVTIPYEAKYGVDIDEHNFKVSIAQKKIIIDLPAPKLLSYELKIDRMETANRKGLFLFQNDETYTDVQKKLYVETRGQMENSPVYIERSKAKIIGIMKEYYTPFLKDHVLEVRFAGDSARVVNNMNVKLD
ncbi:DUF4230 domain-containing protein [Chitinophaga sp. Cy-1792]|uniref:DUF4230 domain-containing protein n=1 Tax=Chitinophaga sp. Cy-1792 TaxID=2608339 RepID=UPI001421C971|nr:DUF4230 domain-containing protein [Chitinophaga sp. Cy-1792]NIG53763.1 DUF4230 domain-containing protein [Chitinophaga sp. Cy-1792]